MLRPYFALGILIAAAGPLFPLEAEAAANVIIEGPAVERATATSAIIGWTTRNPGGTDLHYAVAHYGTSSQKVAETAKSPNRRNRNHAEMTFRVSLEGLKPATTYYYWVESVQATGSTDGVRSRIRQFTTPHSP
jgi:phosphodiesterase/alkaline phosphatase D-like protein